MEAPRGGKRATRRGSKNERHVDHVGHGQRASRHSEPVEIHVVQESGATDQLIGSIAASQHANVTRQQLLAAGLGRGAIEDWLRRGRLYPRHRGVYALGHCGVMTFTHEWAAVLALGDGAFVSHQSAARMWGIRPGAGDGSIDVTVPGNRRSRKGIRVYRVTSIHPGDVRRYGDLPIASPARTIMDIAGDLAERDLERALDEASVRGLVTESAMQAVLSRYPHRRGSAGLVALLGGDRRLTLTRSEAEERFLALVRRACLPPPEVNVNLGRYRVDFLWRRERLAVEIDGYDFHRGRAAFERDRARDATLQAMGLRVLRFTWRALVHEPEVVLVRLAQTIALAPSMPGS